MNKLISDRSKLLIRVLLTDAKISETIFENAKDRSKYKICTICGNGSIIMGKTRFAWWNQLLNCQDTIPFESFALKIWDALVDLSSGINNTAILKGLSQEIVMKSVRDNQYDWVIERLYDCWSHVAQNSDGYRTPEVPEGTRRNGQGRSVVIEEHDVPRQIVLNIDGHHKIIPIVDSRGDSMRLGVEVGITGIRPI